MQRPPEAEQRRPGCTSQHLCPAIPTGGERPLPAALFPNALVGPVHAWAKWIPPLPSRLWLQARVFHVWQRHKAADASEKGMRRVIPEARAATVDEPSQAAVLCRVVPVLRLQGENIAPEVAAVPKVADEQTCEKETVFAAHRCAVRDQVSPHPRVCGDLMGRHVLGRIRRRPRATVVMRCSCVRPRHRELSKLSCGSTGR